mmetsp:Transcript_49790/g.97377  ORF Transcript_49790/g.97377 Transcript_49790/m.97377 type:complete len:627 (-) Transcript_49790:182-2062(-)|eukprot:CAMPEP_0194326426 /NCGR_PEP_ID=MMETSP0171-20130528/36456_1 /TAXON_ID=218684 /ORGANISM="Corethron pennatum, Strain L29A3" /LENGTH=626 /DNA_ID=CAMNT_0039085997 /DNA_START=123 /DNA_END=2003 /DNA_ORIENTATION=-
MANRRISRNKRRRKSVEGDSESSTRRETSQFTKEIADANASDSGSGPSDGKSTIGSGDDVVGGRSKLATCRQKRRRVPPKNSRGQGDLEGYRNGARQGDSDGEDDGDGNDTDDGDAECEESGEQDDPPAADSTITTEGDDNSQSHAFPLGGAAADGDDSHPPRHVVGQKVYAKDSDGCLYLAVIRQSCTVTPDAALSMIIGERPSEESLEPLSYAHFVHYQGWNVRWDKWIHDSELIEDTKENQQKAKMLKKANSKKGRELAKRAAEKAEAARKATEAEDASAARPPKDKTALATSESAAGSASYFSKERSADPKEGPLRRRGLTSTSLAASLNERSKAAAERMALPFSLKRVLVDEWERIVVHTRNADGSGFPGRIVADVPAEITVGRVLKDFLASKRTQLLGNEKKEREEDDKAGAEKKEDQEEKTNAQNKHEKKIITKKKEKKEKNNEREKSEKSEEDKDAQSDEEKSKPQVLTEKERLVRDAKLTKWIHVTEDLASYFDESLPIYLLYRNERPHHLYVRRHPDLGAKRPVDLYGAEYLLRLFVRIPLLCSKELGGEADSEFEELSHRVGEIIRFLQRRQVEYFRQKYRAPTTEELTEAEVKHLERKNRSKSRGGAASAAKTR